MWLVRLSLIGKLWQSFPSLLFSGKTLEVNFDITALLQNTELFVSLLAFFTFFLLVQYVTNIDLLWLVGPSLSRMSMLV